jgi:hypothetical protein
MFASPRPLIELLAGLRPTARAERTPIRARAKFALA